MAVIAGLLLFGFLTASKQSILDTAQQLRQAAALRVEEQVAGDLGVAERTVSDLEAQIRFATADVEDRAALERVLFAALIDEPTLSDIAFTRANAEGYDRDGARLLQKGARWELSVYRASADRDAGIVSRRVVERGGHWEASVRLRGPGEPLATGDFSDAGITPDPTERPTFTAAAARGAGGRALWSDLHWSELDAGEHRRVVMTVQRAVSDRSGRFLGVLRVGLLTDQIDRATQVRVDDSTGDDAHAIFLCDREGRLLSRVGPDDELRLFGDDLRFASPHAPPAIRAALALGELSTVPAGAGTGATLTRSPAATIS